MWGVKYQGNSVELYDHQLDPDENQNMAFERSYQAIRDQLADQLHAGWRKALPSQHHENIMELIEPNIHVEIDRL